VSCSDAASCECCEGKVAAGCVAADAEGFKVERKYCDICGYSSSRWSIGY
jgi:hypothetical protein